MNKKIVFVLLLITIILSVGSLVITLNLNLDKVSKSNQINSFEGDRGNIQLVIQTPYEKRGLDEIK